MGRGWGTVILICQWDLTLGLEEQSILTPRYSAAAGRFSDFIGRQPPKQVQMLPGLSQDFTPTCAECRGLFKPGQGNAKEDLEGSQASLLDFTPNGRQDVWSQPQPSEASTQSLGRPTRLAHGPQNAHAWHQHRVQGVLPIHVVFRMSYERFNLSGKTTFPRVPAYVLREPRKDSLGSLQKGFRLELPQRQANWEGLSWLSSICVLLGGVGKSWGSIWPQLQLQWHQQEQNRAHISNLGLNRKKERELFSIFLLFNK